jgi:hypothetical protein
MNALDKGFADRGKILKELPVATKQVDCSPSGEIPSYFVSSGADHEKRGGELDHFAKKSFEELRRQSHGDLMIVLDSLQVKDPKAFLLNVFGEQRYENYLSELRRAKQIENADDSQKPYLRTTLNVFMEKTLEGRKDMTFRKFQTSLRSYVMENFEIPKQYSVFLLDHFVEKQLSEILLSHNSEKPPVFLRGVFEWN